MANADSRHRETNLTQGSILRNIVFFSLPYLLSYFLQTLYGLMDLYITGQYNGAAVITAVSNGSQFMHLVTVMIVGLAMGSTVMIGRSVGAGKEKEISKSIANTIVLQMGLSVIFMIFFILMTRPILHLLSLPDASVEQTRIYLLICFAGIPLITAYNVISSVFRGLGDSRTPMYFIAVACVVNIALDYLFIGPMHMQAAGAALGTILAQGVSVLSALFVIIRQKRFSLSREDFRMNSDLIRKILQIGVPIAAQDVFIQISFLVITIIANRRGVDVAAAVGIVEKIISFLFLIPSTMLSTVSAIASQNIGAGRPQRAREALRISLIIGVSISLAVGVIIQFTATPIVAMFTTEAVVITLGAQYFVTYVWDMAVAAIHFTFSGYFSAYGLSVYPLIYNTIPIILVRIPIAYFASIRFPDTLYAMGVASPAGSAVSVLICLLFYVHLRKKHRTA